MYHTSHINTYYTIKSRLFTHCQYSAHCSKLHYDNEISRVASYSIKLNSMSYLHRDLHLGHLTIYQSFIRGAFCFTDIANLIVKLYTRMFLFLKSTLIYPYSLLTNTRTKFLLLYYEVPVASIIITRSMLSGTKLIQTKYPWSSKRALLCPLWTSRGVM